jgi:hypothetical protein
MRIRIFCNHSENQIAGETQSRTVTLVASAGSFWHGAHVPLHAETLVGPLAGKKCTYGETGTIWLKLTYAVNGSRLSVLHQSRFS